MCDVFAGFKCDGCDYENKTESGITDIEIGVSGHEVRGYYGWVAITKFDFYNWTYLTSRAAEFAQKARFEHGAKIKIPL